MTTERRLPSLNALRAFEAAGRNMSFTEAAEELSVTPAAVSQQVKTLESYLDVALFHRTGRGLALTDAGEVLLPGLRSGFECLVSAVDTLRRTEATRPLTVTVAPSFGAKWLVPRLARFSAAHPDVEVRLDASMRVVDLEREDADIAVRYGTGEYPGMAVERLLDDAVFPVCSPALLESGPPILEPSDIMGHTLIHAVDPLSELGLPDWTMWLAAAGVDGADTSRGPRFSMHSLAVDAAVAGQGVALLGNVVVAEDLAAGRLVRPLEGAMPVRFAYYLVYPEGADRAARVQAFAGWLRAEAASTVDAAREIRPGGAATAR